MPDKIIDDELEYLPNMGFSHYLAAGLFLTLSLLCGALWVFILLSPHVLKSFA